MTRRNKRPLNGTAVRLLGLAGMALTLVLSGVTVPGQSSGPGDVWTYSLVNGSRIIDDCPICDRLPFVLPMRGTFQMRFLQQGPLFSYFGLEAVHFTASLNGRTYKVAGQGTYTVGGPVGVQQNLFLQVWIDNGFTNELCFFTNAFSNATRSWPMFQISVDQTNGTSVEQYHFDLSAAPFRELWFSTIKGFNASIWNPPQNEISGGDLLSTAPRVVRANRALTAAFTFQPPAPDVGLKDIDIVPGGQTLFSIEQDIFSEKLGVQLRSGDLLSDAGKVVRTNGQLLAPFEPEDPNSYPGLAAAQVTDDGRVYFSVQNAFFSKKLGVSIQPGDLLADDGTVVKTGQQLLMLFSPADPFVDYGLRSVYLWPGGETWFSTRDGFYDVNSNYFSGGDLLSDRGYLVYSNAELVTNFWPVGVTGDLGLDGLYVVTDLTMENVAPILSTALQPSGDVLLTRAGGGRVFQLERADAASGPYLPIGPITTDAVFLDPGATSYRAAGFYRLHQW